MYPTFYVVEGDTLPIFFDTFSGSTGASITMSGLATSDIEIYKDGSATQRASDSGFTLLDSDGTDFDSKTGIHGFSLDLSDNSDSGFYAVGPWYTVVLSAVTVDSQTVNKVVAMFRILDNTRGMAGTALPDAAADAAGGLVISDGGGLNIDGMNTNVSSILTDTGTTLDGKINTIDGIVDSILADTNELQGDWTNGGRLDLLLDATLADTAELQGDWANGGRLDLLVDSILADTAVIGSAGAGLTAVPWNSAWDAEVQSECNDALVALALDHLVSASVAGGDIADNSIIAKLVSKESTADWDDFANTTDSLQAIADTQTSSDMTTLTKIIEAKSPQGT
tara:strand:+ start:420 stop:1433 length:1014 start_codon:yes stop_codon:yes gene_type:complete